MKYLKNWQLFESNWSKEEYIDEIRSLSGVNLKFQKFSKYEYYYYYKVIMDHTY